MTNFTLGLFTGYIVALFTIALVSVNGKDND